MKQLHESDPATIQQTVHGYSEGHRLLACSVRLPKDAERLVLVLSDLTGSTGGEQFDPYLTGYPVATSGYYALARTWPAPEMPRPGCVWTHTLLIREELLEGPIWPQLLLPVFRRPSKSSYSDYLEPIPVPKEFRGAKTSADKAEGIEPAIAERLLRALYGSTDPRTVLSVPRYSLADCPLLSIWRLQWKSLRQRFTFCGGSRGPRSIEGEPFILQAALEKDLHRLDRGPTPPSVVPWVTGVGTATEEWILQAVETLAGPARSDLQAFIDQVGRELSGDTALFRPVVQAYVILGKSTGLDEVARLIEFTAGKYPEAGAGREYKRAFLRAGNLAGLTELAILQGLALSKLPKAFDSEELAVRARSAALWEAPDQAWELLARLLRPGHSPLAEEVIHGLATALPATFLGQALEASAEIVAGIITRNPVLAISPKLWDVKAEHQSRAAAALAICRDVVATKADDIIRAALSAAADPTSPNLIDVFGPSFILTVMEWLDADEHRPNRLPVGWRNTLASHQAQVLEWLNTRESVRPETVAFILDVIGCASLVSNPLWMAAFTKHAPQEGTTPQALLTPLAARLLRVSLSSALPEAVDLAAVSLDSVYHAASESRLPDSIWHELAPLLPDGSWWTWDRCYRLRTGIVEKFRSEQWPAARLPGVTKDDRLFEEIVLLLRQRRSGRRVLAEAVRAVGLGARREVMLSE